MAINFKTKNNNNKTKADEGLGFKIIFFSLNFLLVPFSIYSTFNGYKGFLNNYLAGVLAVATGLMFFGLNLEIMKRRHNGEKHSKQSLGFLVPLVISFFGNFTYFYGNQMEGTLLEKELTERSTTIDKTYEGAKSGLDKSTGLADLRTRVDSELNQLKTQMNTPPKGYGKEAKKISNDIAQLFSDYNAKYNNSAKTRMTKVINSRSYKNHDNAIRSYFKTIEDSKQTEINTKIKELEVLYKPINDKAILLLQPGNEDKLKADGLGAIKEIRKANNKIGQKAKGTLKKYKYKELTIFVPVNAKDIVSVLESAFIKLDNISATVFGIILSLIIDLAVLAFIFLMLSYNNKPKRRTTGATGLD